MEKLLFVYGSLRKGGINHARVAPYIRESYAARIVGQLYHLADEGYPTVIDGCAGEVIGEALRLLNYDEALQQLDQFEEYFGADDLRNDYERIETKAIIDNEQAIDVIVYVCPAQKRKHCQQQGIYIANGDWLAFLHGC